MALVAGTRLGPYEIVGPIGAGGMGEVYRAKDTRLSRDVAIKILPADLVDDPERRARFEREARVVAALNHPNIVTLHEVGTSEAGPYLVLEKIEGQSLREVLSAGPLPVRRLAALAAQIADGLAKAHGAGIVHRDLKPDNIMVTADGFAKILDFGLAKLVWPEWRAGASEKDTTLARDTASRMILGTLGYLSPEQAAGRPADERADQFALGAVLYEMATRERLFRRETMAESLAATIRDEAPPLRSRRSDVPQQLSWIVERCLAKDPNDRYASTKDLARDLADVRDRLSDLTRSQPEVAGGVAARTERPRWLAWAFGALGAIALVAAGYGVGWQMTGREPPMFRPLTFKRGIITGAKFSPDGQTIYYSAAFGAEPSRVFVTRLDSNASEPLKLPPAILLSVSRRGELAVLLTNERNPGNSVGTLARVPAMGGTPRPLLTDAVDADWAPDGERLAVRRANGSIEFPIDHRLGGGRSFPRVSPRGDHVAWIGDGAVQIADTEGHIVVSEKALAFGLAWAPDGREVWFTGSWNSGTEDRALYALSLAGKRRLIARAPGALTIMDVAPDGRGALVYTGAGWFSIVASRRGETQEQSLDLFGRTFIYGLSVDGRKLLAYEWSQVGPGMYLRATDGADPVRLGDDAPLGLSPAGDWALVRRSSDPSRLLLVPTSAGSPRELPIPAGLTPLAGPDAHWSPDGRRLFVAFGASTSDRGSARLYTRRDDGPWQPVTPEGVARAFAVSPDGTTIATADATGVVTLFPVDGGAPRRLDGERGTPLLWSSDKRWLFLRGRGELPAKAKVYRRELGSGRIESWWDLAPSDLSGVTYIDRILLANDGNLCVYSYSRASSNLYFVQGVR